jgi:hypothetical protein
MGIKSRFQRIFDKNNPKQTLLNVIYGLFLIDLSLIFLVHLFKNWGYASTMMCEFLINYQGGFVRRGLIGEILFWGAKNFHINVEWTIKISCLLCFAAVSIFFVKSFLNKGYSLYILPLSFFLGMGIMTNGYWLRRDYLFICVLISILWVYNKSSLPAILKLFVINLLSIFTILCHEVFAFISLPILFLLLFSQYKKHGVLRSAAISLCCLLPGLSALFLIMVMHGNEGVAQTIWNSWAGMLNLDTSNVPYPLSAIGTTALENIRIAMTVNFLHIDDRISSLLVWIVTFPIVYYICTNFLLAFRKNENDFTNRHKNILSSILVFQFFCLFPFFAIISCDWVRIYFYCISSSFVIFLLIPLNDLEKLFPRFFTNIVERINKALISVLYPSKTALVFLMLFTGVPLWSFTMKGLYASTVLYHVSLLLSIPMIVITGKIHLLL